MKNHDAAKIWEKQRIYLKKIESRPRDYPGYSGVSELWESIGLYGLANSILRTYMELSPGNRFLAQNRLNKLSIQKQDIKKFSMPAEYKESQLRVLYVPFIKYPNYGLDIIYDGLCKVLGWENIFEYPRKETLHSGNSNLCNNYPCFFHYPDDNCLTLKKAKGMLENNEFDLVLICMHQEQSAISELGDSLLKTTVPKFVLDQEDSYYVDYAFIDKYNILGYFKRELVYTEEYDPRIIPLTFSYPNQLISMRFPEKKTKTMFWAGKSYYTRGLYIDRAQSIARVKFPPNNLHRFQYAKILDNTIIGLNLFGWGFDTVRYYELPAHGCLLFSERPPIPIYQDYVDGESAVFFSDLSEFTQKLRYLMSNPKEIQRIANNGYEHIKKYHTTDQRAKQMLSIMKGCVK